MSAAESLPFSSGTVLVGDCLDRLRDLPDCSVDSVVTDPPYLISFMGKEWDSADGIAGRPDVWRECLRVLKPGGHLLAFGGTRMYHRMVCAVEDAGFEIRDSIHWTYGSGFPKSLNVGKAIGKAAGAEREVVGKAKGIVPAEGYTAGRGMGEVGTKQTSGDVPITAPATPDAAQWEGWGTALKPSHEPIVVARKPLAGTVAANVLEWGTGALNVDGCRVGTADWGARPPRTPGGVSGGWKDWKGQGSAAAPAGRWPANTILTHAAGCVQTGTGTVKGAQPSPTVAYGRHEGTGGNKVYGAGLASSTPNQPPRGDETVPVFECVPGCPVAALDQQSGHSKSGPAGPGSASGGIWSASTGKPAGQQHGDARGASRFFTQTTWDPQWDDPFLYVAKPSRRERNAGVRNGIGGKDDDPATATGKHNSHPTVKPAALMRHLIRLVTPPGGVVLDPFLGSGTTAIAAVLEGFTWIGCEMTADYLPIIAGRVAHAEASASDTPRNPLDEGTLLLW
jgi:site-specific DNA-methyltransferase (adenine-specific)